MNPLLLFILLILGLPSLELYLLIEVGSEIGALPAIFLVVFTAVLGGVMVQRQGVSTLSRVRRSLDREELPALEMLEGAVLLVAGLLLLIPGFLTDAVGFLCLIPGLRKLMLLAFLKRVQVRGDVVQTGSRSATETRVIEGEFHREGD